LPKNIIPYSREEVNRCPRYLKSINAIYSIIRQHLEKNHKDKPVIDINVEVKWGAEDGFLALEFPLLFKGKIFGDTPFAVEEKDIEKEPFLAEGESCWENIERQRKGLFYAKSFISQSDGEGSVSYLNYDASHYYFLPGGDSIGNILINSVTKLEGWERFVNKAMRAEGTHRFASRLIFHKGDWRSAHIARVSQAFARKPGIIAAEGSTRCPPQEPAGSFLSLEPSNLIMTGFYREGKNFILRFYETGGRKTKARIKLPFTAKKAVKIDLQGKIITILKHGKTLKLEVRPWEIVSLSLRGRPGRPRQSER